MKTLIVYATKYGCAEKCVKKLAQMLLDKADVVNLKGAGTTDPSNMTG